MVALCGAFCAYMADQKYRNNFIHTLCLFYSFITVGLCSSLTGPVLLDLQMITNTNTEQASIFITGAAIGSMVGSVIMGVIYGRWNKVLTMLLILLGLAITETILPWCSPYGLMILMHGLVSMFRAAFIIGGNSDLIRTWQSERRVFVQFLHFSFALGGTLAPLIAEPFLAAQESTNKTYVPSNSSIQVLHIVAYVNANSAMNSSASQGVDAIMDQDTPTHVQYAYLICGIMALVGTFLLLFRYCCFRNKEEYSLAPEGEYERIERPPPPLGIYIVTVGFILLIYFFIVAIETAISSFILTFVVTYLNWSKSAGANITSVFWGCYAAWRFATVFFTEYIPPFLLLIVTSCVMIASSVGALMSSITQTDIGLWICIALSGLALASQFPSMMMWAEESIMRLSPRIISFIVLSCTFPGMASPPLIGYLIQEVSPLWLFYLLTIECGLCLLFLVLLYLWNRLVVQPNV